MNIMVTMAKMNTTIKPILILMLTFQLLFAKQLIQAQDEKEALPPTISTLPPPPIVVCQSPIDLTVDSSWLEKRVFGDFRIWHIMFSALGILTVIAVLLCCLFRCRIPRTKQEIEADYTRKKITKLINAHLRKIKLEELEYDSSNLLPILKRVEDLEENRVKKHRSFETRRLNWRQKFRRFFSRKDASFEDDYNDADQKADWQTTKMTKEEMEKIEKEVESAKIDSTAFNIITDQISVLSYFESDRTRKKRLKEEKKQHKLLEKELKKKEKAEAKSLKQESKDKNKMRELNAIDLVEDQSETLNKIKHQPVAATTLNMDSEDLQSAINNPLLTTPSTPTPAGVASIDGTKKLSSKFSFRNTVTNLMSGLRGGRSKREPETETVTETEAIPDKSPIRDEVVINIGMVGREKLDDLQEDIIESVEGKEFDVIPQIEIPEGEEINDNHPKKLRQKQKMWRMNAIDKNLLQIPEVSIKEINVKKDKKINQPKDEKKNLKDKDKKKEEKKREKVKTRISDKDDKRKYRLEEECKTIRPKKESEKLEISKSKKEIKKEIKDSKNKEPKSKHQTMESIKKDAKKQKPETETEPKKSSTIHFKKVIFEPIEKDIRKVSKKSVQSQLKESKVKQKILKQQARTSIEIPVEHLYTDPGETVKVVQVHHQDPKPLSTLMPMSSTISLAQPPEPLEHMASIEAIIAQSSTNDEQRKLYIEKTRDVKFDVPGTSGTLSKSKHLEKPEDDEKMIRKKKKKVKLPETPPEKVPQQRIEGSKSFKRKDVSSERHKSKF